MPQPSYGWYDPRRYTQPIVDWMGGDVLNEPMQYHPPAPSYAQYRQKQPDPWADALMQERQAAVERQNQQQAIAEMEERAARVAAAMGRTSSPSDKPTKKTRRVIKLNPEPETITRTVTPTGRSIGDVRWADRAERLAADRERMAAAQGQMPEAGVPIPPARYYGATPMQQGLFNFGTNFLTSGFMNTLPSAVRGLNAAFGQQADLAWQAQQNKDRLNQMYAGDEFDYQASARQSEALENVARINAEVQRQQLENQLAQINQNFALQNRSLNTLGGIFGGGGVGVPAGAGGLVGQPLFGGQAAGQAGAAYTPYNFQSTTASPAQMQAARAGMVNQAPGGMYGDLWRRQGAQQANQLMRQQQPAAAAQGAELQGARAIDRLAAQTREDQWRQAQQRQALNRARLTQAAVA